MAAFVCGLALGYASYYYAATYGYATVCPWLALRLSRHMRVTGAVAGAVAGQVAMGAVATGAVATGPVAMGAR